MKRGIRWLGSRLERPTFAWMLIVVQVAVTWVTILVIEGIAVGIPAWIMGQPLLAEPNWPLHVVLALAYALPVGLLLAAWVSRPIARRFQRTLDVSSAWLRGDLALRIADPHLDSLGMLANQLDLLAEHLEQDERDLEELQDRSTRLLDQVRTLAVDEERERLARELHDSVKQRLFSLAMTASAIRAYAERSALDAVPGRRDWGGHEASPLPDDVGEMVREVEGAAQAAQRELTRLIQNLRPASLQEKGLAAALNDYTLLFGAREHVLTYVDTQGDDALLPPSVAEALYRVAQEALHNVARHAQATRVDVRLRCLPEQATLTVADNGIGFRVDQVRRGLGLANMQERMLAASGRVTIDSQPGAGTTVIAEADLAHAFVPQAEVSLLDRDRLDGEPLPDPTIENWAWLGQRLVIPVGQTWPWLPADERHLRRPLIDCTSCALRVRPERGLLGLHRTYTFTLERGQGQVPAAEDIQDAGQEELLHMRVHLVPAGYAWKTYQPSLGHASWVLRRVRGPDGRMVLLRNGQPLAAVQSQGRLLRSWSEIVYGERGYSLSYARSSTDAGRLPAQGIAARASPPEVVLADEMGAQLLVARDGVAPAIELRRPVPLPLLVMAALQVVEGGIQSQKAAPA
jgi:signal transduction histidine kinase